MISTDENRKLNIPDNAVRIIRRLESAGYEAYVVGGCVRDTLLGKTPNDWDITTSATPEQMKAVFGRTIDTGIKHGTVTILINREPYEVTTYRIDGAYEDSRHPSEVTFTSNLREDLCRRDFTINAMAYHPERGLVDLFGGEEDLQNGVIRCVGDPEERFTEDALRILRALRFSAQLGFSIEEGTRQAIVSHAQTLSLVSAERISAELVKLLVSPHPDTIREAYRCGVTAVILPEFDLCMETEQNTPHHCYTVGEHILHTLTGVRDDRILRLTMLLHDIAKPVVKQTEPNGRNHFKTHSHVGAKMAEEILRRLKMDNETIRTVCKLIHYHDYRPEPTMSAVRRAVNRIGQDLFSMYLEIQHADICAQSMYFREQKRERLQKVEECYAVILQENQCVSLKTLAVSGKDLIEAGFKPGQEMGALLNRLLEHVLDHPEDNRKDILLELAKEG